LQTLKSGVRLDSGLEATRSDSDEDLSFLEIIERKKSQILAEILIDSESLDISFEDFSQYDYCLNEALYFPEEIYEYKDKEGDILRASFKTFINNNSESFFYIVLNLKIEERFLPVFSFPTKKLAVCLKYQKGFKILGATHSN